MKSKLKSQISKPQLKSQKWGEMGKGFEQTAAL
jgi:hypothetical protein